jgi:hypothetical protein
MILLVVVAVVVVVVVVFPLFRCNRSTSTGILRRYRQSMDRWCFSRVVDEDFQNCLIVDTCLFNAYQYFRCALSFQARRSSQRPVLGEASTRGIPTPRILYLMGVRDPA